MAPASSESARAHAWEYFALHSSQRMTAMNFYLVVASILATAIVTSFDRDFVAPKVRVPAGALLGLTSFVFWRLDLRSRTLIKLSEDALAEWEMAAVPETYGASKLVTRERGQDRGSSWLWPVSYYECFRLLFILFGLFGLVAALTPYILGA